MNQVKITFDGYARYNKVATEFIVRDLNEHVLLANAKNVGQTSITVAKCLALRDILAHAVHNGWLKVFVEEDSELIIECINKSYSLGYYDIGSRYLVVGFVL